MYFRGPVVRIAFVALVAGSLAWTGPLAAQAPDVSGLAGKWTYRSFHNNPVEVGGDPDKALRLIFAEAIFTFETPDATTIKGAIDWPGGGLDLNGTIEVDSEGGPPTVHIIGAGRPGTGTEGWEYDYHAQLAHKWPAGVDQVPALVGSVLRAKPHGAAQAGYVASFVAVKRP